MSHVSSLGIFLWRHATIDSKKISQNNEHMLDQYYDTIANGVINMS